MSRAPVARVRAPLQALTFMRKEIADAIRQPRLLVTLVLGPFLIMAAFGLGYRETPKPLRTLFVIAQDNPLRTQVDSYTKDIGDYVEVAGITSDETAAMQQLQDGKVDVVVSFPTAPLDDLAGGNQSKITIVHTRIDPVERTAISFASELAVDKINAGVLTKVIAAGQFAFKPLAEVLGTADEAMKKLSDAVNSGDQNAATAALADLRVASDGLTTGANQVAAAFSEVAGNTSDPRAQQLADQANQFAQAVQDMQANGGQVDAATVTSASQSLSTIHENVGKLADVDPAILASPFTPDVQLAVPGDHRITDWYAPAAIVLILQQFGLAFGAMSFVRERQLGLTDVLRVAPIGATPALIGKYLAYLLLGGAMGAILTTLMVTALDVPVAGSIGSIAAVMGLTLFASIGLGLVISLLCRTEGQAIQYALLVLLASLFFSGFFLSLSQLAGIGKIIALLLPVSYGMAMLRDVMLRGVDPDWQQYAVLAAYGAVVFVLALIGAHRRMSASPS